MNMIRTLILMCLISLFSVSVPAKDTESFHAIKEFFDGISSLNQEKISHNVSHDFQLLEVGEVWALKDLLEALKGFGGEMSRRNFFKVIDCRVMGDIVSVSYWNKAVVQEGSQIKVKVWLESALLIRDETHWRIHLLHSTRLPPESYPKGVNYEEYITD